MATFQIRKQNVDVQTSAPKYPEELMQEYHALTDKKLHRTISKKESTRLTEVRSIIERIDAEQNTFDVRDLQAMKLREELSQLRAEVDALPDVSPGR